MTKNKEKEFVVKVEITDKETNERINFPWNIRGESLMDEYAWLFNKFKEITK